MVKTMSFDVFFLCFFFLFRVFFFFFVRQARENRRSVDKWVHFIGFLKLIREKEQVKKGPKMLKRTFLSAYSNSKL